MTKLEKLRIENKQLKTALKAAQSYADKLVANIPYLPADIENLRQTNAWLTTELDLYKDIHNKALNVFSIQEFPGPFTLSKGQLNDFSILNRHGEVMLRSGNETFISFVFMFLNKLSKDISDSN